MTDFQFANPAWGYVLWFVFALVVVLFWFDQRGSVALNRFLSLPMQERLALRTPRGRRWSAVIVLGLAAVCFELALMRPQWG